MSLVLARVDDRLIHGQVVVGWVRALEANVIVVADDVVAADPMQKMILPLAVPPQIQVEILPVHEAARRLKAGEFEAQRVVLLFSSLTSALVFVKAGGHLSDLNVGGLRQSPGRLPISVSVAVGPEDVTCVRALDALGVVIELRMLPADEPLPLLEQILRVPGL